MRPVYDSLRFGPETLTPWFAANFDPVETFDFHNVLSIPTSDDVIDFYRAMAYYDASAEAAMGDYVEDVIAKDGVFAYEKNGYLIMGRDPS